MSSTLHAVHEIQREAGERVEDRRQSVGTSPRNFASSVQLAFSGCSVLIAIASFAVMLFGGVFGTYVVMQTRAATTEVSNQQLVNEVQKVSTKLDSVADDVKGLSNAKTEQAAKLEALEKSQTQNETQLQIVASKVGVVENKVATLTAQVDKR